MLKVTWIPLGVIRSQGKYQIPMDQTYCLDVTRALISAKS